MNGKDYCNCDHVTMFRHLVQEALDYIGEKNYNLVKRVLTEAINRDIDMREDYERQMRFGDF